jgi:hypothetical protein
VVRWLHSVCGMRKDEKLYVLVVGIDVRRPVAYGPFRTRDDAEYAATNYYGTAITGASARDAILIAELRAVDPAAIDRAHDAHVEAMTRRDD